MGAATTKRQMIARHCFACVSIIWLGAVRRFSPSLGAQLAVQAAEQVLLLRTQQPQGRVLQSRQQRC